MAQGASARMGETGCKPKVRPSEDEKTRSIIRIIGIRVIIIGIIGDVIFRRSRAIMGIGYWDGRRFLSNIGARWWSGRWRCNQISSRDKFLALAGI